MTGHVVPDFLCPPVDCSALRAARAGERAGMIERFLCRELEGVLDGPPEHVASADHSLRSQGVGSIRALRLKRTLELALRVEVPAESLLTGETVREVAVALCVRVEDAWQGGGRFGAAAGHGG